MNRQMRKDPAEERFVKLAQESAHHDLDEAREMRKESQEVAKRAQKNHWAEAVRKALGGR